MTIYNTIQGREISVLLNPRPVILATCCDEAGRPNVFTVAWHTPLAHDPPLLGISVARSRFSHSLIARTREFALNLVGSGFEKAVEICGNCSGKDVDKVSEAGLRLLPACHIHPPLIAGALAHLECVLHSQVPAGDHTLFIGQVLYAQAQSNAFSTAWTAGEGDVLLVMQRDWFVHWSG